MHKNTPTILHSIAFSIITFVAGLLPLLLIPSTISGVGALKSVLLYVGVFLAFSLVVVGHVLDGTVHFIKNKAFIALAAWGVLAFVSALTSANTVVSLWGRGFAVDSFATTAVLVLFVFLLSLFATERQKVVRLFFAVFFGAVITSILQIVLYVTQNTSFIAKYFSAAAGQGTIVGSWIDFAYFTVIVFILGLLSLEILAPKKLLRIVSIVAVVVSLFTLVFLNFSIAWIICIVTALLAFVYKSSINRTKTTADEDSKKTIFPTASFVSLLVGLFFYLSSASLGGTLANYVGLTFNDIRPSFSTSTHIMRASLAKDPIFGAGAGRYGEVWNLYHPLDINKTVFWNSSFDGGFSFMQSVLTTNGILPVLALLAFMILSIISGFIVFKQKFPDAMVRFVAVASYIISTGFFVLLFVSYPGIVIVGLGFFFTAIMLGLSVLVGKDKVASFNYLKDPRISFFSILLLFIVAITGFSSAYFSGNRFVSIVFYNRALLAIDATVAQQRIDQALALSQNDIYWRTRTALFTNQFSSLAAKQDADKALLQSYFTQAEQSASAALAWDQTNANNWLTVSQVYQLVSNTKNVEAFNNGKKAAEEAQKRNPNNPVFFLNNAQLAMTQQNTQGALDYIAQALSLKADYLDGFLLRAQIARAAGDTTAVKNELLSYIKVAPYDEQGYVLLSQAASDLKDYDTALSALAQVRQIAPANPNYYIQYIAVLAAQGNKTQAVAELQKFKALFPRITGVDDQIARIQAGTQQSAVAEPVSASTSASETQSTAKVVAPTKTTKTAPKKK